MFFLIFFNNFAYFSMFFAKIYCFQRICVCFFLTDNVEKRKLIATYLYIRSFLWAKKLFENNKKSFKKPLTSEAFFAIMIMLLFRGDAQGYLHYSSGDKKICVDLVLATDAGAPKMTFF